MRVWKVGVGECLRVGGCEGRLVEGLWALVGFLGEGEAVMEEGGLVFNPYLRAFRESRGL